MRCKSLPLLHPCACSRASHCVFRHVIICGGYSREEQVSPLSNLFPQWRSSVFSKEASTDEREAVHCGVFLSWFNSHLCVNEVVYPSLSLQSHPSHQSHYPRALSSTYTGLLNDPPPELGPSASHDTALPVSPPSRVTEALSTLAASRPTTLADFHMSTHLHIVTSGPIHRKASTGSLDARSRPPGDSSSAMSVGSENTPTDTSDCMSEGGDANMMSDSDNDNYTVNAVAEKDSSGMSDIETDRGSSMDDKEARVAAVAGGQSDLPHLVVKGCARASLYFLSPFASATVVDCQDCEVASSPIRMVSYVCDGMRRLSSDRSRASPC